MWLFPAIQHLRILLFSGCRVLKHSWCQSESSFRHKIGWCPLLILFSNETLFFRYFDPENVFLDNNNKLLFLMTFLICQSTRKQWCPPWLLQYSAIPQVSVKCFHCLNDWEIMPPSLAISESTKTSEKCCCWRGATGTARSTQAAFVVSAKRTSFSSTPQIDSY